MNYNINTRYKWLVVLISFLGLISCKQLSKNERLIFEDCNVEVTEIKFVYVKDPIYPEERSNFWTVFQLKIKLAVTNNSGKVVNLKFNNIYTDDYNCEIHGELPGFKPFIFYHYPFRFKYKLEYINPEIQANEKRTGSLESPLLPLEIISNYPISSMDSKLDSLKLYLTFKGNNELKKEIITKNIIRSIGKVKPHAIGAYNPNSCVQEPEYY